MGKRNKGDSGSLGQGTGQRRNDDETNDRDGGTGPDRSRWYGIQRGQSTTWRSSWTHAPHSSTHPPSNHPYTHIKPLSSPFAGRHARRCRCPPCGATATCPSAPTTWTHTFTSSTGRPGTRAAGAAGWQPREASGRGSRAGQPDIPTSGYSNKCCLIVLPNRLRMYFLSLRLSNRPCRTPASPRGPPCHAPPPPTHTGLYSRSWRTTPSCPVCGRTCCPTSHRTSSESSGRNSSPAAQQSWPPAAAGARARRRAPAAARRAAAAQARVLGAWAARARAPAACSQRRRLRWRRVSRGRGATGAAPAQHLVQTHEHELSRARASHGVGRPGRGPTRAWVLRCYAWAHAS